MIAGALTTSLLGLVIFLMAAGFFGWLVYRAFNPRKHDPLNRSQWHQRPQFFLFALLALAVFAFLFSQ